MSTLSRIVPCLWFADQALPAAEFYTNIFPNARICQIAHYAEGAPMPAGSVLTVAFELDGHNLTALNGGPLFTFNEAVSFQVLCDSQDEIDHYWDKLGAGGPAQARQCGWLKDRYGLSWQVLPRQLGEWMQGPRAADVMAALLKMEKLELATLAAAAS
ncbi:VOC family protein [Massilia sp. TS11]|uniref:VOC family protein n=1 Tax=Massilia sp. TS11 TaxID=2908003 RepID=UPI001EDA8522|nr:VOC family protein [Massilia sp. TS11]MCG2586633.1 VOC family protein [Massilia sp. TS11]